MIPSLSPPPHSQSFPCGFSAMLAHIFKNFLFLLPWFLHYKYIAFPRLRISPSLPQTRAAIIASDRGWGWTGFTRSLTPGNMEQKGREVDPFRRCGGDIYSGKMYSGKLSNLTPLHIYLVMIIRAVLVLYIHTYCR